MSITVNPKAPARFSVRIRVPNRAVSSLYTSTPDANGITSVAVNGAAVKPAIERGYAVITRAWRAGDRIELVLPMRVQRVRASEQIAADRGRVALRYGPLVYNIERVDQDITKALGASAPLTTEWKGDLLGGVMVIKGAFRGRDAARGDSELRSVQPRAGCSAGARAARSAHPREEAPRPRGRRPVRRRRSCGYRRGSAATPVPGCP